MTLTGLAAAWLIVVAGSVAAGQSSPVPPFSSNDGAPPSAIGLPARASAAARADAVQRLLDAKGAVADVPLAVAAFPAAPRDVILSIEIGARQILPDSMAIGIRAFDDQGRVVFNGATEATVAPAAGDAPSPLHHVSTIELPPGVYRVRVAVVDSAGRAAAVDHSFEVVAAVADDPLRAGSLMLGLDGTSLRPLARGNIVRAGARAWMAVGAAPAAARARLEILDGPGGAVLADSLAAIDAPAQPSRLARAPLPVALLPPGGYVARLVVEAGTLGIARTRPFTLGRLPPPEPSALGEFVAQAVGRFAVSDVLDPRVLAPVLTRALDADPTGDDATMRGAIAMLTARGIAGVSLKPFAKRKDLGALMLRGASLLQQGALEEAAGSFREALRASSEFLPAIVYLGACYAAGGRDREAVGAWQTALVTETGSPLVFRLAADGLVRLGDSAQALSLLEEASERWPEETALVRRHALALAAREGPARAVDALLPALEQARAPDADLLALASRLAVVSAARGDEGSAARVASVRAVAERTGPVPPLLARWDAHLTQK